ncbi:MAG: ATP-binding protein [Myxococcales bacterium]|nr:ATP-binding protein [Myxococcales bacterium]
MPVQPCAHPSHRYSRSAWSFPAYCGAALRASNRSAKTLEDFDFQFNTNIPKAKVIDLATGIFVAKRANVLFVGPSGVGKSHLAQALGHRACRLGHTVVFVEANEMFKQLRTSRGDGSYDRRLLRFTSPDVLIVDDLGLRALRGEEPLELYEIIRQRYEKGSTIITTNRDERELAALFADPLIASAAIDRLLHHAHVLVIEGDAPGGNSNCNQAFGRCDQCVQSSDCPVDHECVDVDCVAFVPCANSLDCAQGDVCDAEGGRCGESVSDADCDGSKLCAGRICRASCDSDNDCTSMGLLCLKDPGHCAECTAYSDCEPGLVCGPGGVYTGGYVRMSTTCQSEMPDIFGRPGGAEISGGMRPGVNRRPEHRRGIIRDAALPA